MFDKIKHMLSHEPENKSELIDVLQSAEQNQLLDSDALQMIEGVLAVSEMKARDIMIPRPQMTTVNADQTPESAIPIIVKSRHSRFPVVVNNQDKILGILLAKDLLPTLNSTKPKQTIRNLTRPALFIPESKRLDVLLKEFRLNRNHMAIVLDEYGSAAGLVTIEDVLEQIVGDIEDEYDVNEKKTFINRIEKGQYLINGLTPIDAFNNYFHTNLATDHFDTIGGLISQKFGHLPKRNEQILLGKYQVTVVKASRRGVKLLRLTNKIDNTP